MIFICKICIHVFADGIRASLTQLAGQQQRILKMAKFGGKFSLFEIDQTTGLCIRMMQDQGQQIQALKKRSM